jgi:pyruvate-formate lyase-activating enzyme
MATLRLQGQIYQRRISAVHLSRPEHYLSVYQSGCSLDCSKCHSADFSQRATGEWLGANELALLSAEYESRVTVTEPRHRATMYHAEDLCYSCGSCLWHGSRSEQCPGVLDAEQIVLSPQGFGPARNIVAFTGGDVVCAPEYYVQSTRLIKEHAPGMWVLLETNGLGLDAAHLETLAAAGVDALWLDIKAFDDEVHHRLTGVSNRQILQVPQAAIRLGMVVEVLTLYIPGWVEADQIEQIARLCAAVDTEIPLTILAFFPAHRLHDVRPPTHEEMLDAGRRTLEAGCKNVRLGNLGVFCNDAEDMRRAKELTRP